jgi:hypothetical protein
MSRYVAVSALVLFTSLAASSAISPTHLLRPAVRPGASQLHAVGVRGTKGTVSDKLDGVLADLERHLSRVRPGHALADLHALSPAAHFGRSAPGAATMVAIDATTRGAPQELESALLGLGLEQPTLYRNDVGGFLPIAQLDAAAARPEVSSIRAAMLHRHATGPVATQGDYAQQSDVVRSEYPSLTGKGITVGVLSDSFDCYAVYAAPGSGVPASGPEGYAYNGFTADYATDVSTGALPANVTVVEEPDYPGYSACMGYQDPDSDNQPTGLPFSDEGRAMLQIVYAVAPGANLVFRTGNNSEADFASGIEALEAAPYNAKIEADDLGYFDEPFFQDGIIAQAIDTVESEGVSYFSAAGNNQETPSYYNTSPSFSTLSSSSTNSGEYLLNFDATGATTTTSLPVTIPPLSPGDFVAVVVEWDQPYVTGAPDSGGATSQIDLCITGSTGQDVVLDYDNQVVSCSGPNAVGADAYQVMIIANPANAAGNTAKVDIDVQVGLANGTAAPGKVIVAVEDDGQGSTINKFSSPTGATLQGHPGASGAAAVGAAFYFDTPRCGTTPAALEPYSAAGGLPILFSTSGTRLATPTVRQKPDFVGPDGVNNTFLGFTLASDSPPYPASGLLSTTVTECQNNAAYPNFFGTSAATPHAAAIAALMLQANAALTPSDVYGALRASALALPVSNSISSCATAQPNFCSGYGFIQAETAMVTPALSSSEASIAPGGTVTLTWASANASSCTATGGWSGALPGSGSQSVTAASTAGSESFTLSCADSAGNTGSNSVALDVEPAPAAPTLTLASSSIQAGSSTTITWSSTHATSCTASGSWSGSLATSGSQTLTPSSAGTDTYSLSCSNAVGASPAASVTLTVTAARSSGGGALGTLSLFGLVGLWFLTLTRARRATDTRNKWSLGMVQWR